MLSEANKKGIKRAEFLEHGNNYTSYYTSILFVLKNDHFNNLNGYHRIFL